MCRILEMTCNMRGNLNRFAYRNATPTGEAVFSLKGEKMIHFFDIDIAKRYGVMSAVLLQNLQHWIEKNKANGKNFFDGHYWTYNSKKAFERAAEEDNPYYELVSQWFPSAKVHPLIPKEKQAEQVFEEFIKKYGVTRIPESAVLDLVQRLNGIFNTKLKSVNTILKKFTSKKLERTTGTLEKSSYHRFKVTDE